VIEFSAFTSYKVIGLPEVFSFRIPEFQVAVPPKHPNKLTTLHSVITHNTIILAKPAVKFSKLTVLSSISL